MNFEFYDIDKLREQFVMNDVEQATLEMAKLGVLCEIACQLKKICKLLEEAKIMKPKHECPGDYPT